MKPMIDDYLSLFIDALNPTLEDMGEEPIFIEDGKIRSFGWLGEAEPELDIPEDRDGILATCQQIMERCFDYPVYAAKMDYYRYELEEYALTFAKDLKAGWKIFGDCSLEAMPIYITSNDAKDQDGEYLGAKSGVHRDGSGLISIYNASPEREEDNKRTARHEVIHHLLGTAGLNNLDDSPLFWFFATIYDAEPYMEMSEEGKRLFDILMGLYRDGAGKADAEMGLSIAVEASKERALSL